MKIYKYLIVIVLCGINTSCSDFLNKYPLNGPSSVNFLQTEDELRLAINGLYNSLWFHSLSATGQWEYITDCATDIAYDRNASVLTVAAQGSLTSTHEEVETVWQHYYKSIARCNFVLENINKVQNCNEQLKEESIGQAKFIRVYSYSKLIDLFGNVPLVMNTLGIKDNEMPRVEVDEIVDILLSDLNEAFEYLPDEWINDDRGRVTKWAALALKSRIALVYGRYDVAAESAWQVITSKRYSLYPNYEDLFNYKGESCSEVIFELMYQYGFEVHRMPISVFSRNAGGNSTKVPTQSLVDSYECIDGKTIDQSPLYNPEKPFENRDPRLRQTIVVPGDLFMGYQFETHKDSIMCWDYNTTPPKRIRNQDATNAYATFTGYCWRKTTDKQDLKEFRNNSSLNFILIRLGEILLNYAEAKIELNEIDQTVLDAINQIRARAYGVDYKLDSSLYPIITCTDQKELRKIIRRERKIELAMEGFRLKDIRRWGIAHKVLNGPLYGRPKKEYGYKDVKAPAFDEDGVPNYEIHAEKYVVVEQRSFNPNRDYLWPIPQKEIDVNRQMVQNPNY